jgi:D-alanyl-D-alanine carboxypeptidase
VKSRVGVLLLVLVAAVPALAVGPRVDARAYLVQNGKTGEVLLQHRARERLPIASITKLMTVLVTLDRVRDLDRLVTVSGGAASIGESSIYLRKGERITVRDLIQAALIQSANDAARALAEHVGGGSVSRFVGMMNAKAARLGLRDTHFANPDGLDAFGHYSSARDVTRLARIAMRKPFVRNVVRRQDAYISGGRHLRTWNDLLSTYPGLFGVKTGHTAGAGWSEVAAAQLRGVTVYATLLGSPERTVRNDDLAALLTWGLTRYRWVDVVTTSRVYGIADAPYGRAPLALLAPRSARRLVRVDRPLLERVVVPSAVSLPVRLGQRLGHVQVFAGKKLIASRPLVASRAIARPGFFGRTGWYAGEAAHEVWSWFT